MHDLLIIGGGPAGYVAAERAGHKGLNVILFEKKALGGACLNEGCIPTKTLLYSAKMYENALQSSKYGVLVDNARFQYDKIIGRKNKIIRKLIAGIRTKMSANNVTVIEGEATIQQYDEQGIVIECNNQTYIGKNLLICTGSEAFMPPIPGIQEAGDVIVTNREILAMKEQPKSLVVIGGGVIGTEFAGFFNSLGTKVTVIEMLPEILGGMDLEISTILRDMLSKKGIEFHLQAKVEHIDGNKVVFIKNGSQETVEGEKILLSVGRKPVTHGYGLENIGIELTPFGGIKVDEKMKTNLPHVYAAGDVTGFSLLAHTAGREAEVVVNNLLGYNDLMRYNAIPGVVYTNPEVAGVGHTEESATRSGIAYKVVALPMTYSGRFVVENEGGNGLCKVLIDEKKGNVIGVHILGNPCSEMIFGAVMAIDQEMSLIDLQKIIFPHPSVSEILKEVAFEG